MLPFGLSLFDLIDITLVATLIYQIYKLLVGTRAFNVLRGIFIFTAIWLLAQLLDLVTLASLLGEAGTIGLLALLILFQSEFRAALERLGRFRRHTRVPSGDLAKALERLAERKTGALIAVEGRTPLGEYAATGVALDALVSTPLLETLFDTHTPLHDGGIIIRGTRLVAAGCLFPLQATEGYKGYGTRHRAALGLSEVSDALIFVVSEERGSIRIAQNGKLGKALNRSELREQLLSHEEEHV